VDIVRNFSIRLKMVETKNNRIELRVTSEQKRLLEQASSLKGVSLTAYTLSHILEIAKQDINNQEKLILSNRDRDLLLSTLENPPELKGNLKSAIARYRQKYEL